MLLQNKDKIKRIIGWLKVRLEFVFQSYLYSKKYKGLDKDLFSKKIDKETIREYKRIWSVYKIPVETRTLTLCYNLSGKIDLNIVPENIFSGIIESKLNKYKGRHLEFLSIKNFYERWHLNKGIFPKSYLHKVDGIYYDRDLNVIEDVQNYLRGQKIDYPLICKPSLDTSSGDGVLVVTNENELCQALSQGMNLVIQEKINQNFYLNEINNGINTVRACLYRDKTGFFKVINNSIRFGVDGSLDNEGAGGIFCNIKEDGTLNEFAFNKSCDKFSKHPNSGVVFSETSIPFYKELNIASLSIANQIPLCNLVSLDMCLDSNNSWRCIEINLRGQTTRFTQYSGVGFFGEYTKEVISRSKKY